MPFLDDVADQIAAQVTTIGLSTSSTVAGEVTGDGYTPLAPTYGPAAAGVAELADPLPFDGPPNAGPITHLIFRNAAGVWAVRPVPTPLSFNSDGRLDLATAAVTAAFPP